MVDRSFFHRSGYRPEDWFSRLPTLETKRLILRRVSLKDAQDVFAYSSDPQVAKHVLLTPHRTVQDSRGYLRYLIRQYRDSEPSSYGIVLKETGAVVGTIGYMGYSEENRSAEVGYSLARSCWNQGLMTEALSALLEFSFREMKLHRVWAVHEADNPASGRVMQKCGMRCEGLQKEAVFNKGRFADVVLYAMLSSEWPPAVTDRSL